MASILLLSSLTRDERKDDPGVLNHAGSSVTAGYIHYDLKWADYVEQLVQPAKGMKVIR